MIQAAEPPAAVATVAAGKAPEMVVVSRDTSSAVIVSKDTPLALIKAGRSEDALLRQAIYLSSSLVVVRPAAGEGDDILRWTYQAYLQRQLCFTSITGLFSCAAGESEALTETAAGETPLTPTPEPVAPASNPAAEAARAAVVAALSARAPGLFIDDRRLKLDPLLRASGVAVRPGAGAAIVRRGG